MSTIEDILKATGDELLDSAKSSIKDLLTSAKGESEDVVKETGALVEKWLVMRANGELDNDELKELLESRKIVIEQFLNTQEIQAKKKFETMTSGLIDIVANKLIEKL